MKEKYLFSMLCMVAACLSIIVINDKPVNGVDIGVVFLGMAHLYLFKGDS